MVRTLNVAQLADNRALMQMVEKAMLYVFVKRAIWVFVYIRLMRGEGRVLKVWV